MAFLPLADVSFESEDLPLPTPGRSRPSGRPSPDVVLANKLAEAKELKTFKTATSQAVEILIAHAKTSTLKLEAMAAENARLSGQLDAILALLTPRVSLAPSPLPPTEMQAHYRNGQYYSDLHPPPPQVVSAVPVSPVPISFTQITCDNSWTEKLN